MSIYSRVRRHLPSSAVWARESLEKPRSLIRGIGERLSPPAITSTLAFVCLLLSSLMASAQNALPHRASPDAIRDNLDRILARPEFQKNAAAETALIKSLQWISKKWDELMHWLEKLLEKLFRVAPGLQGNRTMTWIFLILFLVVAGVLVGKLIRTYLQNRTPRRKLDSTVFDLEEAPDIIAEPEVWRQQAEEYARQGDYRRAFRAVFLATLLHLNAVGVIEYHRSRTNGDYLRFVRRKGLTALEAALRPLVNEFDGRWYGHHATVEADYHRCLTGYERIRDLAAEAIKTKTPDASGAALAMGKA